jgi:glycosyltransferase involved in cell wall biosynthesis
VRSQGVRALLGASDRDRIVLAVARLGREKNLELAIDAMVHAHVDLRLAIVGEGPHRAALVARARTRGVEARVRFTGALPPPALPDLYASADAFAFTSLTDTQGLVLGEARAAGLPIVASDSAVAREMAGPGARIAPAEPRAFAAALAAAANGPRGSGAGLAGWAPEQQARAMETVYRAAQSAVHLALC